MISSWFLRRIGWFGIVGVTSSALYAGGVLAGIDLFGSSRMVANTFGFLLSTASSYLGDRFLTFRADGDH
jgi:putative flippase GtrA